MSFVNLIKIAPLVIVVCALSACGRSKSRKVKQLSVVPKSCEVSGASFGIVGGKVLGPKNQLSASTVMIIHIDADDKIGLCTGTLISKDKVLSAAHCTSQTGKRTMIAFTNNIDCVKSDPKGTIRTVVNQSIHPDYSYSRESLENGKSDLAVFKFTGKVPEGYMPRALPEATFSMSPENDLVMAGYGITDDGKNDSGILRFTQLPSTLLLNEIIFSEVNEKISIPGTILLDQEKGGVCHGDSGGPLYNLTPEGLVLVGVTSRGLDNKNINSTEHHECHGVTIFTDVRAHIDWISAQLKFL